MRLVCEWIEVDTSGGSGALGQIRPRVSLFVPLAEAELVEAAFMNIVWNLLIVDCLLIGVTTMLSLGFEQ